MTLGQNINVKISAYNSYGESTLSEIGNGGVIELVPDAPVDLLNVLSITLDDRIGL